MAVTLEELQIKFTAQMGSLNSQLNGVKTQINGITSSVKGTSTAFAGMARAAKLFVSAFVIKGMVNIGKASIEMANDVVESEQLFAVSMKGMADEARKWSDDLSGSLGLNAYSLRRNVGTFNTMFMSMGLGTQAAYDMSTSLVQLAEDMASFYNVDPEEMFTKLRAGITGETEPLKRLGIMVDEQTVKQYALSEGISTTGKALTQTEKLMARYAAIMGQTSNAQGDLARTINSPVNQIRLLNNQLDMAKIALGQAFMPIQAVVLPILTALANAATTAAQALAYLMGSLGGFGGVGVFASSVAASGAEANQDLADSLKDSAKAYKAAGGAAKKAAKDAKVGLKAFDEINKLTEETTKTGGGGGGIDEVDVPDIEPANDYANALQVISDKVRNAAAAIKEFWDGLKNSALGMMVEGAFGALKWLWEDVIKPFGEWAIRHPDVIGNVLGGIAAALSTWNVGKMMSGGLAATALGKGVAAIGAAIAAHPALFSLAVAAGGITLLAGAINSAQAAAIKEENENRFGKLTISLGKLKNMCESIGTPFTNSMKNLESDFAALKQAGGELRSLADLNAELIYGYHLNPETFTKDKITELIASVQAEVDKEKDILGAAQIKATMGLEALFTGTQQDGSEILKINAENWAKVKEEGAKLGKEYLDAVTSAAFDGVITAEEQQKAYDLQAKMLELTMIATDPETLIAKAQIRRMGLDFDGATLTPETVTNWGKALDEKAAELNALLDEQGKASIDYAIAVAIQANPDISDAELAKLLNTMELALAEQKLKANWEIEKVRITAPFAEVEKAFKDVLDKSKPAVNAMGKDYTTKAIEYMLNSGYTAKDINTRDGQRALASAVTFLMAEGVRGAQLPEGETKAAMQEWLDTFKPDYTKWTEMAAEYKRLGLTIPTELADGIYNYEAMLAVAGSTQQLKDYVSSQADLDTTVWSAEGKSAIDAIVTAFSNGETDVQTAAAKIVKIMEDEIEKADLVANVKFVVQGLVKNIQSSPVVQQVSNAMSKVANTLTSTFKNFLGINSPSTVFAGYGEMITAGLVKGIDNGMSTVTPAMNDLAKTANGSFNANLNGTYTADGTGISGAIEAGIERGISRIMNLLNINLNVDGERFGSAAIRTINDTQRAAGRLLLEM